MASLLKCSSASTSTARIAHREWATRPRDERYASVHALHEAARARPLGTLERRIDTGAIGTLAVTDDDVALRDPVSVTTPSRTGASRSGHCRRREVPAVARRIEPHHQQSATSAARR